MKIGVSLALLLAATAGSGTEKGNVPSGVPKAYLDCATGAINSAQAAGVPEVQFDCTKQYYKTLPGHAGSTREMGEASTAAIDIGVAYIDSVLVPRVRQAIEEDRSGDKEQKHTATAYLESLVRHQRNYAEDYCSFVYDLNWQGSIRGTYYGGCKIEFTDALADQLIDLLQYLNAL